MNAATTTTTTTKNYNKMESKQNGKNSSWKKYCSKKSKRIMEPRLKIIFIHFFMV